MIKLNLNSFGGGGGSSGGSTNRPGSQKLKGYISSREQFVPTQKYYLLNITKGEESTAPGSYFLGQIDKGNLSFDKSLDMWVTKKAKYQIRKIK